MVLNRFDLVLKAAEGYQLKNPKHFSECLASIVAHCFVVSNDNIIDITATQFGSKFKAIEIRNLDSINIKDTDFWETTYIFNTPSELLEYQKQFNWFKEQRVDNCKELDLKKINEK